MTSAAKGGDDLVSQAVRNVERLSGGGVFDLSANYNLGGTLREVQNETATLAAKIARGESWAGNPNSTMTAAYQRLGQPVSKPPAAGPAVGALPMPGALPLPSPLPMPLNLPQLPFVPTGVPLSIPGLPSVNGSGSTALPSLPFSMALPPGLTGVDAKALPLLPVRHEAKSAKPVGDVKGMSAAPVNSALPTGFGLPATPNLPGLQVGFGLPATPAATPAGFGSVPRPSSPKPTGVAALADSLGKLDLVTNPNAPAMPVPASPTRRQAAEQDLVADSIAEDVAGEIEDDGWGDYEPDEE